MWTTGVQGFDPSPTSGGGSSKAIFSEDGVPEVIGLEQFGHGPYDGYHFRYLIWIWFI